VPQRLREINPDVPEAFEAIVVQAMAKNPNDRYTSADELRQDLLRFRQGRMVMANPTVAVAAVDATVAAAAYEGTTVVDRTTVVAGGPAGPPPQKRGTGPFLILLLVMILVLGGLLYLFGRSAGLFGADNPKRVAVPFVIGKTAADARTQLEGLGLTVNEATAPTDQQEAGKVFEQDPQADTKVDKGGSVTIRVAAQAAKVKVPPLVGKSLKDAQDLADTVGVKLKSTDAPDPKIAKGQIVSQDPPANTDVNKGSEVAVVVSSGKAQKTVPDVTNQDAADAANALGQAGFRTKTSREASSSVESGKVIRTDPRAGTGVDDGSTITIVVSSGVEQATVPNVLGMTAADARAAIEGAGLVYKEGVVAPSNISEDGKVVSQNPGGNTKADKGSTVTVRLGKAVVTSSTTTSTTGP
jgi:beta-lactam-binding protein with PASTA domain